MIAICAHERVIRDFRFCDGFKDAAGSVCRNISEGFRRYESAEIVQFFRYALASSSEVKDYLIESELRGAIGAADRDRLLDECDHTESMMLKFIKPHLARTTRPRRTRPRQ